MRILKGAMIALALVVAVPAAATLSACSTTSQASGHLTAAKSLYVAELAYNAFARSIVAGAQSGLLTGDKLATAKKAEASAYSALLLARQGKGSVDAVIDSLNAAADVVPVPTSTAAPGG